MTYKTDTSQHSLFTSTLDVFWRYTKHRKLMSAPSSLLRSAPHNVPKVPFPSITPNYRVRQSSPITVTRTSRNLATVNPGQKVLADVWFTGLAPRQNIPNPPGSDPQKPPDERTVKLGKSKHTLHHPIHALLICKPSSPHTPRTTPNPPSIAPPPGNPLAANNPPSLPLNTSSPPHRLRSSRLLRRSLDFTHSMGPHAPHWERKTRDPLRANGQILFA